MSADIKINTLNDQVGLGPTQSLQLLFAKLQLTLAEQCKTQAMNYMDAIAEAQEKSKEVAKMIQTCRELQSQAKNKEGGGYYEVNSGRVLTAAEHDALITKWEKDHPGMTQPWEQMYKKMDSDETAIPPEIKKFMEDNGLALDKANDGRFFDKDGWEVNITSLRNYQEQLGTDTQQKMVFIQDFMGQYNSYLQGANSAIQQSSQTLTAIARGQ